MDKIEVGVHGSATMRVLAMKLGIGANASAPSPSESAPTDASKHSFLEGSGALSHVALLEGFRKNKMASVEGNDRCLFCVPGW
jgi:hypothetical protein